MIELYHKVAFKTGKLVTEEYSTSFSLGVRFLDKSIRDAIYSVYGFVRFADEIVDTFHAHNKERLLDEFEQNYYKAYNDGISLNPILHCFQLTVKKYHIQDELIQAFIKSMRQDLHKTDYEHASELQEYIYGSADVVGLMCLKVFVEGDDREYERLKPYAMKLGSAFQKVNFLRDINKDIESLGRSYFPQLSNNTLTEEDKRIIIEDINQDYAQALIGINQLPDNAKTGVLTAYLYYKKLTDKIASTPSSELMKKRVRVSNFTKCYLLLKAITICKLN